jgi:hypothetical protein
MFIALDESAALILSGLPQAFPASRRFRDFNAGQKFVERHAHNF